MLGQPIISLDIESSGLELGRHVPLSVSLVDMKNPADNLYVEIEYDDLIVSPSALRVNHWDFTKEGRASSQNASHMIKTYLQKKFNSKLAIALGRGVRWDVEMIKHIWWTHSGTFPFHHRNIDIASMIIAISEIEGKDLKEEIEAEADIYLANQFPEIFALPKHHAKKDAFHNVFVWNILHRYIGA